MIQVTNLLKKFGAKTAVNIAEFKVDPGEIVGIAGNNGAGKTTLLRLMLDLLKPDKGSVISKGIPVYQSEHWKTYTGSYIDTNFLIDFLKPEEYFEFIGDLYNIKGEKLLRKLETFEPFMNHEILGQHKYIRQLSSGNKHKVGIIGALIPESEVVILDEPFNFLDPRSQIILKEILKNLSQNSNTAIIISSHNLNHISDLCSRIILMENGVIIKNFMNSKETMTEIELYFSVS